MTLDPKAGHTHTRTPFTCTLPTPHPTHPKLRGQPRFTEGRVSCQSTQRQIGPRASTARSSRVSSGFCLLYD
eukprot:scaffold47426_cov51-Phaeocystis_antarctica.AAC.5